LFLAQCANRATAGMVIQRRFSALLDRAVRRVDPYTVEAHTLYFLCHTEICMRIIKSHGNVSIFNVAENAGKSVNQIERFYAKYLPLSKGMARTL